MYNQGKIMLVFLFATLIMSCNGYKKEDKVKFHTKLENFDLDLYNSIKDTLSIWRKDSLISVKQIFFDNFWQVDSLILINNDTNKMFGLLLAANNSFKNGVYDDLIDLAGAKINGKWYFFFGSSSVIDRATYQDSIYSPLTFDELSYLARQNLAGAFYKDGKGDVKVRESFFDFMDDPNGWGLPPGSTRKDIDSVIVARNKEMHTRKIDPKEIEQIKAEMAKSVRPKEPIHDIKWYKKIFPKKKKLFETDEWKEYVKSKSSQ